MDKTAKKSIAKHFFKNVFMGFGSALVLSLYSVVDAIMVGRYEGELGMAAVATIVPIWTIALSIGLLFGIGGGIRIAKCLGEKDDQEASRYFTTDVIWLTAISLIAWLVLCIFDSHLLTFFGADEEVLPLALLYVRPIKTVLPFVIAAQALGSLVRNDGSPLIASIAVIVGGVCNIVFDYLLVFTFDMGIYGAGIATAGSECLTCLILVIRLFFFPKRLRLTLPTGFWKKGLECVLSGLPSFVIDASTGIMAILMNRQIVAYFEGNEALAIYGVIGQLSFVVLSLSYGLAHAVQPLVGRSYGAGKKHEVRLYFLLASLSSFALGLIALILAVSIPEMLSSLFIIDPDQGLLTASRDYILPYAPAFLLMVVNVFLSYFYISTFNNKVSLILSVLRSVLLPILFIYLLPGVLPAISLFYAIPLVELIVLLVGFVSFIYLNKKRPGSLYGETEPEASTKDSI